MLSHHLISKWLGKRLAHGSSVSEAFECTKDKQTQKHVILAVGQIFGKKLCSNRMKFVQRFRDAKPLQDFSWDTIVDEAASMHLT